MRPTMQTPRFTEEALEIMFLEKSRDYPGGRIALLSDGRVVFPEIRFTPEIGKKYSCRVRFYERGDSVIGIAFPAEEKLSETEYLRDEQVTIAVTFVRERGSDLLARHPVSGAYIVPTDVSRNLITEGIQCWVMIVQRGTALNAHFIKNVESEAEKPPAATGKAILNYDPSFAASAENDLIAKKGMGKSPVFFFQGKNRFPWEILGIPQTAEMNDIRKAYRSLSKKFHPDKNPQTNHEDFVALAHAHDWATLHRQWTDDISAKIAARSSTNAEKPVAPITKKAVKPAAPIMPPAESNNSKPVSSGHHSEFPLDDENKAKLAALKAEKEAGKNGDQTIDCLDLKKRQITKLKTFGFGYLKAFLAGTEDEDRLKAIAEDTKIPLEDLVAARAKATQ